MKYLKDHMVQLCLFLELCYMTALGQGIYQSLTTDTHRVMWGIWFVTWGFCLVVNSVINLPEAIKDVRLLNESPMLYAVLAQKEFGDE